MTTPTLTQAPCQCGDRAATECPGEWEPGCDLGANEAHVRVAPTAAGDALAAALATPVEKAAPSATLYAEARECPDCGHIGINDDNGTSACTHCDWSGPSPAEDHCPGCGRDGTMTSACPECGHRTTLLAEAHLPIPAQQAAQPVAGEPAGRLHADGYFTWRRRDGYVLDRRLPCDFYLTPAAPAPVALTGEQIDAGAQKLAALFDYPWEHMPAKGRETMRANVRAVLAAVGIKAGKDGAK